MIEALERTVGAPARTATEMRGRADLNARLTPVREAFEVQEKCIASLHEVIDELERRLVPALVPPEPSDKPPGRPGHPVMLVGTVHTLTDQTAAARDRLRSVLDRLAL